MVASAPRYHSRLLEAIAALDDRRLPIAETWRQVGLVADAFGLTRPSYSQLRRLVHEQREHEDEERERREALRAIAADVATRLAVGRLVDAYVVADRVAKVDRS